MSSSAPSVSITSGIGAPPLGVPPSPDPAFASDGPPASVKAVAGGDGGACLGMALARHIRACACSVAPPKWTKCSADRHVREAAEEEPEVMRTCRRGGDNEA